MPQSGARFGETIAAVNGNFLIGEPSRSVANIPFVGQSYLFDGVSGNLKYSLANPEPAAHDSFGSSLDGGDGLIFVGSPGLEQSVYVFDHNTGSLLREINPPAQQGVSNGLFGSGLAYGSGDLIVVDPSFSVNFGPQSVGEGYQFNSSSGDLRHLVPNPEPNDGDVFGVGIFLGLFGNKFLVGTIADNANAGRVWIFDRATAQPLFALQNPRPDTPPPLNLPDFFGWSAAANEKIIVVGANEDDSSGVEGSGTVFVFDADSGDLLHTLYSPQLESNGEFGRSVALTPDGNILVGAWGTSVGEFNSAGHVYLFSGATGNLLLDIPNPAPTENAQFGWSLRAIENRILVGAVSANALLDGKPIGGAGAIYVFDSVPEPNTCALSIFVLYVLFLHQRRLLRPQQPG